MLHYPNAAWIVFASLAVVPTFALLIVRGNRRERERRRRFELMEAALRNPNLNSDLQRELVQGLRQSQGRGPFVAGWFGLFGGIAWLCCEPRGDEFTCAIVLTVLSFALLTLPFALRELETRKA